MLCVLNLAFFMKSNILCKLFLFVKDLNDTDIGSLHNLEEIRLHNNKLTHLPPGKSKARQCYNRSRVYTRRWTLFLILDFFQRSIPTTYIYRNCLSAASWSPQKQCLYPSSLLYFTTLSIMNDFKPSGSYQYCSFI